MPKAIKFDLLEEATGGQSSQTKEEVGFASALKRQHDFEWALCCSDFWYFCSKVETFEDETKRYRPMPLDYPYLRRIIKEWDTHQKSIFLKPRRMMISWLAMLRFMHRAMFAGTGLRDSFDGYFAGIASVDEDQAKYQCERVLKVYRKLPTWMQDRNPMDIQNQTMLKWRLGGKIQGFPMKKEGPQGYGFSDFLFDEMAVQEAARTAWTGLVPAMGASGGLIAVSTPNGKGNIFHDIWINKDNSYEGVHRIECDWWDHPEHDDKWFEEITKIMDDQMIARMFLKSFSAYAGKKVWPEFDKRTHVVEETEIIEGRPMLIGHDFGFLAPSLLWVQRNHRDQFVIHRELCEYEMGYDRFLAKAIERSNTFYDRRRWTRETGELHFCDPAGRFRYASRSQSGAVNDIAEIKTVFGRYAKTDPPKIDNAVQVKVGSRDVGTRIIEGPRLKEVRKLWGLRTDGHPGIIINSRCTGFIEGCEGAYCYPDKGNSEQPLKNEASNVQDSLQYLVTGYSRMFHPERPLPEAKAVRRRIGRRTGL